MSEHIGACRAVAWRGGVYVIRDVWAVRMFHKLARCEYAVLAANEAQVEWKPCPEGVMFADIEPLVRIEANDGRFVNLGARSAEPEAA